MRTYNSSRSEGTSQQRQQARLATAPPATSCREFGMCVHSVGDGVISFRQTVTGSVCITLSRIFRCRLNRRTTIGWDHLT